MNSNTALIMFAVIAAFGVATATVVIPILNEAHAIAVPAKRPSCSFTPGACKTGHPGGPS
jgi:hypothetical protein